MQAEQQSEREALCAQITAYLSGGGLFNPELADHIVVRDMLIACRAALSHPSTPQGRISVDERLPEKHTEVLIAFAETSLASTGQYTGSAIDHDGWCYPAENQLWPGESDGMPGGGWPIVRYWQPLPDVPPPPGQGTHNV